ncbi:MAG: DMT family transporter, partial [Anaerolineae bacterium]|nr:DMT family transporter [Anaerolineae bacterium]
MSSTTNWKHILLLFVPGTLWGSSFLLNEISLQTIPPATLTGVRNLLAIPLLLVMLRWTGGQLARSGARWRQYAFIGFFNNAFPFFLISWGQQFIESGLAAILLATMPLCTILLAHFLTTDEKLTAKKVTGIGLGLAGVLVLIGPGALRGLGLGVQGQLAVLGASLSYAVGGIYARNVFRQRRISGGLQRAGLVDVTTGQFITSVIFMLPWMVAWEQVWTVQPSGPSWWALVAQS